ncbi:hypothetical protein SVIOM74S_02220 [Streptomyces violarus]
MAGFRTRRRAGTPARAAVGVADRAGSRDARHRSHVAVAGFFALGIILGPAAIACGWLALNRTFSGPRPTPAVVAVVLGAIDTLLALRLLAGATRSTASSEPGQSATPLPAAVSRGQSFLPQCLKSLGDPRGGTGGCGSPRRRVRAPPPRTPGTRTRGSRSAATSARSTRTSSVSAAIASGLPPLLGVIALEPRDEPRGDVRGHQTQQRDPGQHRVPPPAATAPVVGAW